MQVIYFEKFSCKFATDYTINNGFTMDYNGFTMDLKLICMRREYTIMIVYSNIHTIIIIN